MTEDGAGVEAGAEQRAKQGREAELAVILAVAIERAERFLRLVRHEGYPPDQFSMVGLMAASLLLGGYSPSLTKPTRDDFIRLAATVFDGVGVDEAGPAQGPAQGPARVAFTADDFATLAEILKTYERVCEVEFEDQAVIEKVRSAVRALRPEARGEDGA